MNGLTLEWEDDGQKKIQQIFEQQASKNPGTVRLGRDPLQCDIVLTHGTVSGLHVEIFFDFPQQKFYIRNLRSLNPPLVDGQKLVQGEMCLTKGSIIYLGQQKLQVTAVSINNIPPTILLPPTPKPAYSLQCHKCQKVSPAENLQIGCPWCGTSLAAAISVLVAPNSL
ncbi:FHA domain-containing protein [Cronbergia sp. UHCC 0137]|uniref:FHA domain-containing protein n=1 Tax=Cronbergia sp. UHCC 0137 TaxID=3110239 RepID=UPI002B2006E4|nr:FHA domain-containing protein [Cronbergia sp. UHCC 0137]MEA5619890.1 FHA domain-containing protein [Cronbergia sp. UHCC 0137]